MSTPEARSDVHVLLPVLQSHVDNKDFNKIIASINSLQTELAEDSGRKFAKKKTAIAALHRAYSEYLETLKRNDSLFVRAMAVVETHKHLRNQTPGGFALETNSPSSVTGPPSKKRKRETDNRSLRAIASNVSSLQQQKVEPGDQVAANVDRERELWILTTIVRYDSKSAVYEVEDEDSGDEGDGNSGHRHYRIPRNKIIPLPKDGLKLKWNAASKVHALYPETTSFYAATVKESTNQHSTHVMVAFDGDEDETGSLPAKEIPLKYVVPGTQFWTKKT